MKISKLFHWLYAILMFLPFGLVVYNALASMWSGAVIDFNAWISMVYDDMPLFDGVSLTVQNVYQYLVYDVFGIDGDMIYVVRDLLTYWTCISIIWLIFDVLMYVPLLVHRWIDKAKIE